MTEKGIKQIIKKLDRDFRELRDRIYKHRDKCIKWQESKPCFNCHVNTLSPIIRDIRILRETLT
jgi:hypothetical protein